MMFPGTVITTVYNGLPHIQRFCGVVASASEAAQVPRWLVCDDGSDDGTVETLTQELERRGLADRVRIASLGRLGRARALNAAVAMVDTPCFFIHDFDDISYPHRFAAQAKMLEARPELACVGAGYVHINADTGQRETRATDFDQQRFLQRFPLYVPFPHTFMAFRTDAVRSVGGYPPWDDYEEMGLIAALVQSGWKLDAEAGIVGEHFIYEKSFFERQYGFARRRWRNARRQLAMRRQFPFIRVSRAMILARFAYNFLPDHGKALIRRAAGYAR